MQQSRGPAQLPSIPRALRLTPARSSNRCAGTQPGTTLVMSKRGVPKLGSSARGDHLVHVKVGARRPGWSCGEWGSCSGCDFVLPACGRS